ncbi:MAG: glycosyltransferase [Chloroflexi bacterium]|nr:glycosyltransferase [Chloroflexota bacterium]MCL5074798.1 glycosyltransferase [Chloroflexota bacterium]
MKPLTAMLPEDASLWLQGRGKAELVIGIPSFNNASTIGYVVRMAAEGAVKYFPDLKPVIINADGGSTDGTRQAVLTADIPSGVDRLILIYSGPSGKGSALRAIFGAATLLKAKACVVLDSDLRSVAPAWIERLAAPIVRENYGYVTPLYKRHKYDGTITNNIAYPLTRALYGWRVRQPIGGDFGFCGELARRCLEQEVWESDVARYGIDIWMTTTAVSQGFALCQADLGVKIHDVKDPAVSLGPMFRQVVGTLFALMTTYEDKWKGVTASRPLPVYGESLRVEPEPVVASLDAMVDKFYSGVKQVGHIWKSVMSEGTFKAVMDALALDREWFSFPAETWAHVVYDFAVAYNGRQAVKGIDAADLIAALTPLYYARTAGLISETLEMDSDQFEEVIESQAVIFEQLKPYLLMRWDG